MRLTVAVCTLDRPRLLGQTLESLARADLPGGLAWEVLVVDNGGARGTAEAVEAAGAALPVRRVREPKLGLSHARNRSVEEAEGESIAWIDDDVRVDRSWLTAYVDALDEWPEAAFFGGPIRPEFEGTPPPWLRDAFETVPSVRAAYGARDVAAAAVALRREDDLPFGGNMLVRKDVLPPRPFDPRLGRRGGALLGGEEIDALGRLLERGREGRWVPGAGLVHVVPPERQTLGHLRRYFRGQGRVQDPLPEDLPVPTLFGRPRWALRARIEEEVKYRLLRPFAPAGRWVPHLVSASFAAGAIEGPPEG